MQLSTEHWRYLHGKPTSKGDFKQIADDFVVEEQLSFSPSGEGEHLFLFIEKQNLNTGFVAQELAKHYGRKERDVAYAGRKDKFATTRQWFSVYLPGKSEKDKAPFDYPNCTVLAQTRHTKKLRLGAIDQNRFTIHLRNCELGKEFDERIRQINTQGVPNYYGSQRFGNKHEDGSRGNLALAQLLISGEEIRKRDKRSMAISALRSWLFNEFVSQRIEKGLFHSALAGDVFLLNGSNSFFSEENLDDALCSRLKDNDILLSAPLWGDGELACQSEAFEFEYPISQQYPDVTSTLARLGLKQERRAIHLHPKQFQADVSESDVKLQFSLPSGCFATSVIRELFSNVS